MNKSTRRYANIQTIFYSIYAYSSSQKSQNLRRKKSIYRKEESTTHYRNMPVRTTSEECRRSLMYKKKQDVSQCKSRVSTHPLYAPFIHRTNFKCLMLVQRWTKLTSVSEKGVYLVSSRRKVMRSFRSLAFLRPPKAILVPGMYFFGFSR